jgi:hypothetical protein
MATAPSSSDRPAGAADSGVAKAHRALAMLFLLLATAQFFLAGLAVFSDTVDFDPHAIVGSLLTLLALVLVILAFAGRRSAVQPSAVLLGLMIVQHVLGGVGEDVPILGALHPVNGLLILGVAMLTIAGSPVRLARAHGTRA